MNGISVKELGASCRSKLSTAVIVVGVVILLTAGFYLVTGYPWHLLFSQLGWTSLPADLPDPSPLPVELLTDRRPEAVNEEPTSVLPGSADWKNTQPLEMVPLGIIKLPKIGVSENIVEGVGDELLYAVGHAQGTAMPGQEGNCVLAGHRNYIKKNPFRYVDKLAEGDVVRIKDDAYQYTYEVFQVFQVDPHDVWVMEEQEEEAALLTLITCTREANPTGRLIVWCRLVAAEEIT